jgi:myo-inositol-1(or 4)-monophosphatase
MTRQEELAFTTELAKAAAAVAMAHYGKVTRLTKSHRATQNEAVTEADRACQRLIVAALRETFPGDGIIGEESDSGLDITVDVREGQDRVWVIDPIDGTNNFVGGADNFAICIGLLERGMPVLGVVYDVTRARAYAGAEGLGASVDGKPTKAKTSPMDDSSIVMLTSNVLDSAGRAPGWINTFLSQTNWKVRILGTAALEAVSVGAGIADAAITVNGKLWDCVAPAAIVLASDGIISDLTGGPIFPFDLSYYGGAKVPYLSAGPAAHAEILRVMLANP